jgi:electron transport complex protein RnfB
MDTDIYIELSKHLDAMPAGFPKSRNGSELKLLKKFYTPEQAKISLQLTRMPQTSEQIAKKLEMDPVQAAEKIEQMAKEGSVFRISTPDGPLYLQPNFIMGIYEWHVNAVDKDVAEYADDYYEALFEHNWKDLKTKQLRIVPVDESIETKDVVRSYDVIRDLVKGNGLGPYAVAPCICRVEQEQKGVEYSRPLETCLTFGLFAQYTIENGIGKALTEEQLMAKLKECEEAALIPFATNSQKIYNMCMCDTDSCQLLKNLKNYEKPSEQVHSTYFAGIDPELCSECEACLDRCQLDAITESLLPGSADETVLSVDTGRCIGCGLCVTSCPEEAIKLQPKTELPHTPKNGIEMEELLLAERTK